MPTDAEIESSLRKVVQAHNKSGSNDAISVNVVRTRVEQKLGLDPSFFRAGEWKQKSKDIIHEEFDANRSDAGSPSTKKRSSPSPPKPPARKKAKLNFEEDQDDSTALSDPPDSDEGSPQPTSKKLLRKSAKKPASQSKSKSKAIESDEEIMSDTPLDLSTKITQTVDDTGSELSSVLDEPISKKKRSKSTEAKPKSKSTTKSKTTSEPDANTEEIKRLQGWLVKCGIRKVWGKELKPYETPKAKINHLKSMLADVGMTGRYSNEKASAIKEQRELAADIEAVQEGNEKWGKDAEEEEEGQPKKRLVRGASNYAFLSSDGEETD